MLASTALRFANHILAGEAWARARLQFFAGQTAHLEFGKFSLPVAITSAGLLTTGDRNATPAVTISLPDDAPLRAFTDRPSLLANARIAGSADLAETLGFVLRNLRWDAEDDLSRLLGDIAAHRLVQGGRQLALSQLRKAKNFALNVAEYLTEEDPTIARRADVSGFCRAVDAVQDDCTRFEKRLQRLESR